MSKSNTPILLVIFNRPDKIKVLIESLSMVKPKQIFIFADGPRGNVETDEARCIAARLAAKEAITWECEVKTNFLEENVGCDSAVPMAIDWFFDNVEAGIILEDDCIPHPSFFSFCTELLEKYKDDEKVMHISGNNFQNGIKRGDASYYFSLYTHSWGWATWKRAWQHFRPAVTELKEAGAKEVVERQTLSNKAKRFWQKHFENTNFWDGQWQYAVWNKRGLSIIPNTNLVSNIGFDNDSTHTSEKGNKLANASVTGVYKLKHPDEISVNIEADDFAFKYIYHRSFLQKISDKILYKLK